MNFIDLFLPNLKKISQNIVPGQNVMNNGQNSMKTVDPRILTPLTKSTSEKPIGLTKPKPLFQKVVVLIFSGFDIVDTKELHENCKPNANNFIGME